MTSAARLPTGAASLSLVLTGVANVMLGALLPGIVAQLGISDAQTGLLAASPAVGYTLAVLGSGLLGDLLGYHRVWLLGALVALLAAAGVALAPSYTLLVPAAVMLGLVPGFFDGSINPLLTRLTAGRAGGVLNRVHSFFGVGATLAPLAVGLALRQGVDWRWQFGALTLLAAGVLAAIRTAIGRLPTAARGSTPDAAAGVEAGALRVVRPLLLGAAAATCYGGIEAAVVAWTPLYLTREHALRPATASLAIALFGATLMTGRFLTGLVVERIGYRRLIVAGGLGGALGLAVLLLASGAVLPWLGLGLAGLSVAGIFATLLADASAALPARGGLVTGLICAASGLGKMALPWLVGLVAQEMGLGSAVWLIVAVALLLALLYAWR